MIRSVTRNGRSIILTAVLALILVYMFSIIGYIFFKDDFLVPVDDDLLGKLLQKKIRLFLKIDPLEYLNVKNPLKFKL